MDLKKFTNLGNITTPFGARTEQEAFHPGIDVANRKGTSIPAFVGGRILQTIRGIKPGENNFGNSIILKDKNGNIHRYSHLNSVNVKPGETVRDGQQNIATMGDSGAAYSPTGGDASNLDYRIVDAFGRFLNPQAFNNP